MSDEMFEGGGVPTINFSDVEEASYEVIKPGVYNAIVEDCEYGLSQSSGKPMWTLVLTIMDGEYENRKLWYHISFSPKALPMAKRDLRAINPELISGEFNPQDEDLIAKALGRQVRAQVKIETYNGEKRNRVNKLSAPTADTAGSFL